MLAKTGQWRHASARHEAVQEALRIPPDQRQEALWLAVANEVERVGTESHQRTDALAAGRDVPSLGADHGEYAENLTEALGQWHDIRALQPLITIQGGMLATVPIVQFGEAAVTPLIDAVRNGHWSQHAGALMGLQILLEGWSTSPYNIPPANLSAKARSDVLILARDLLRPKHTEWGELGSVAGLALATGDQELRGQLELLAAEPGIVSQFTGLVDVTKIQMVQNSIKARLDRHPK